jgi:endo-1,4-beta-xylanase
MLLHSSLILALAAMPMVSAQLHLLAKAAGLKYFGTATDNGELIDAQYRKILSNTDDFGQVTASNQMKVSRAEIYSRL